MPFADPKEMKNKEEKHTCLLPSWSQSLAEKRNLEYYRNIKQIKQG